MSKVIEELDQLLADSMVFAQNLHNYHWNIQGCHFIPYHGKLGEMYDAVSADVDVFAERILQLGGTPTSTLSGFIKKSGIEEEDAVSDKDRILELVLRDLYKTVDQLNKTRKAAVAVDDEGTNAIMGEKLLCIQKQVWMFSALMEVDVIPEEASSKSTPEPEKEEKEEKPKRMFKR